MHKKFVAFFSVLAALAAVCPLSAKKLHSRHKKAHTSCCVTHKKRTGAPSQSTQQNVTLASSQINADRNYCDNAVAASNVVPIKTHYAKINAQPTTATQAKPSTASHRRAGRHKKRRTCIVRRRKVRRASSKPVLAKKEYTPEQREKIAKLRTAASFIWPIQQTKFYISSPFGARRNPNGTLGFHFGIDMAAPKGTPVVAAADGIVLAARPYKAYGNMIFLGHRKKLFTRYAHLDRILVKEGEIVRKGTVIGRVGNTGRVRHRKGHDGSHLHWETYIKNKRINPRLFI
jgi:murein DD-endopeptidase MepM/ murein hydrolase activator NlpD